MNREDPDFVELVENTMDEINLLTRIKGRALYSFEINKIADKHLKIYKRRKVKRNDNY